MEAAKNTEQANEILGLKNPFSSNIPTSQKAEHFSQLVQQQLQEQAIIKQKEQEIQQQAETLQKATEIEKKLKENLDQIQEGLSGWSPEKVLKRAASRSIPHSTKPD